MSVFYTAGVSVAGFLTNLYLCKFREGLQGVSVSMFPIAFSIVIAQFPRDKRKLISCYFIFLLLFLLWSLPGSSLYDIGGEWWPEWCRVGFGCSSSSSSLASSVVRPGPSVSFLSLMNFVLKRLCHVRRFPMSMRRRNRVPILRVRPVVSLLHRFQISLHSTLDF